VESDFDVEEVAPALSQPVTSKKVASGDGITLSAKDSPSQLKLTPKQSLQLKTSAEQDSSASIQTTIMEKLTPQGATTLQAKSLFQQPNSMFKPIVEMVHNGKEGGGREGLASSLPTAPKKGTLPPNRASENIFADITKQSSKGPRKLSSTSSAVSQSADRSRYIVFQVAELRALVPVPVSQRILEADPID
jgi:hypothetical protein